MRISTGENYEKLRTDPRWYDKVCILDYFLPVCSNFLSLLKLNSTNNLQWSYVLPQKPPVEQHGRGPCPSQSPTPGPHRWSSLIGPHFQFWVSTNSGRSLDDEYEGESCDTCDVGDFGGVRWCCNVMCLLLSDDGTGAINGAKRRIYWNWWKTMKISMMHYQ